MLWYDEPAREWTEALPVGNGRMGAMVFGGAEVDHIQFNEETLWTGKPRDYSQKGASEYLDEIRQLLFDGQQSDAEALAGRVFMGKRSNVDNYPAEKEAWLTKVRQPENLKPAAADFDDSQWKSLQVPSQNGWERVGLDAVDGALWFRYSFDLPESWKDKVLVMELGKIRETDFTYFNGTYLGSETDRNVPRVYEVPARLLKPGKNVIAVQILNYQNKGGFVGLRDFEEPMMIFPKGEDRTKGQPLNTRWKYYEQDVYPPEFPQYEESYQPFGDLWFEFPGHENPVSYRRQLDISNAMATTTYEVDGVTYTREYFMSAPHQALMVKFSASQQGQLNFRARADSPHRSSLVVQVDEHTLGMEVKVQNGALRGVSYLRAHHVGGDLRIKEGAFEIKGADEVVFYLTAATNFKRFDDTSGKPEQLAMSDMEALVMSFDQARIDHIKDYQQYFNTFSIDLGASENEGLTTDERIVQFGRSYDPALAALYVQYGRYLMIATSRPGTRPPNLQGIWNDQLLPPWGSKYTTNINLEMNYWPVEVLNLSDLHEPLFELISEVAERGAKTAKDHYDADGWVLHHNTDLWRGTAPINNANHGIWVTGGAWLCHHLWEHYLFTRDTTFLREKAYPLMKGSAEFFVDFLIEDPETGFLISTPSNSPENGGLVSAPSMDHQIIRNLFSNVIATSEILEVDRSFRDTLKGILPRIAPNRIGRYGQLQEWLADIDDPENKHRHVSHLWAVYPGNEINMDTPELLDAARQSLIFRGDEGTGWSLAWKINLWARFRDGEHAWNLVKTLLSPAWGERNSRGGSYPNLFDAHPPFQIDGNFGASAGIAEMIVQSQGDQIELLPALPKALPYGEINGLMARGGFELDIRWQDGQLESLKLVASKTGDQGHFIYKGEQFDLAPGEVYTR